MIKGTVQHGDAIGRTIGYPTANLSCSDDSCTLPDGVYAAKTAYAGSQYESALVINSKAERVEVFLFDFSGDLYGKELSVEPLEQVSEITSWQTLDELKAKIDTDVAMIKDVFSRE